MLRSHRIHQNVSRRGLIKAGIGSAAAIGLGGRITSAARAAQSGDPVVIGMSAAFSGPNASAGEAQLRGAQLAADEINAAGGVLGRPLTIVTRDNVHEQDKGVLQTRELIEKEGAVGILGSQGSFIAIAVADTLEELEVPWIGLSTGAAAIIDNGQDPNWMFRVSSNDPWVAEFLVRWAVEKLNVEKIGILNEDTGWGVPAIDDVEAALKTVGLEPSSVDKMKVGDTDFTAQMLRAKDGGSEAIVTFSNSVEMANALKAGQKIGYQPQIVSAWGLQNPNFITLAPDLGQGTLVMQTYTWVNAEDPKALDLLNRYTEEWGVANAAEIPNPSFTADAYDATHLFALAIETAGAANGAAMRDALEQLPEYAGLIKTYAPAFTPDRHDALTADDYFMCEWSGDELVPLGTLGS
jgi:branched-chain amino acid transport system substrate-binding protein